MEIIEFRDSDSDLHGELLSLHEWLRRADDLRESSMRKVPEPVRPGTMGAAEISHLVVQVGPLEVAVLAAVVTAWLRTRGVDLDAERTSEGRIKVSIRRARKGDTAELGEQLFDLLREAGEDGDASTAGPAGGEPRKE